MNLVHALLIGVVSAACRYTNCIVASWGFHPMRQRLIIGGKQRIPFTNLGPCSGEDRDKLGVPAPMVPVGGELRQMGFHCMYFRGLFLPPLQEKLPKEGFQIQNNNVRHLHCKINADDGLGIEREVWITISWKSLLIIALGGWLISQSNNCYWHAAFIHLILKCSQETPIPLNSLQPIKLLPVSGNWWPWKKKMMRLIKELRWPPSKGGCWDSGVQCLSERSFLPDGWACINKVQPLCKVCVSENCWESGVWVPVLSNSPSRMMEGPKGWAHPLLPLLDLGLAPMGHTSQVQPSGPWEDRSSCHLGKKDPIEWEGGWGIEQESVGGEWERRNQLGFNIPSPY